MNKKIIFISLLLLVAFGMINSISAHEAEYPDVYIDSPKSNEVVSGEVDFNMTIDDHHETLYVNVTATHRETNTVYFNSQDSNPNDGWSCKWDTSDAPNGKYYVSAVAMNSKNLKGQYNILITLNNTKKTTDVILDNAVGVAGEPNTIVAHLYDENSKAISGKSLEITVDGESFTATTSDDGAALLSFTPKEAKEYNLTVRFNGDNVYAPSQATMTLTVLANSTTVTTSDITANSKQKILLTANLKNYLGLNANRTIDFYIDGAKVASAVTDENGDAKAEYAVREVGGSYVYTAEFVDENNTAFKAFSTLYVPESSLYVRISAVTYSKDGIFTAGNKLKIIYTLYNDGPDTSKNVTLRYAVASSLKYVGATPSQGTVSFTSDTLLWNIGDVNVGNQTLEVEFTALKAAKNNVAPEVSTLTYDNSVNANITRNIVNVKSYTLKAKDLTKYYTGNEKFTFTLKDSDGVAVKGATVTVTFKKQKIVLKTDSKGTVKLDTKSLGVGKYTIKASCSSLSVSKKIVVKPLLVTKNLSKKKAKTIKFTAKLLNNKGKIVKNKKITFKLKGKTYTAKTNKKGIATVSFKNLKVGKYTVKTSYGKSAVKNTITIKK